jgi:hypothetical protein
VIVVNEHGHVQCVLKPCPFAKMRANAEHVLRSMLRRYPGYVMRKRMSNQEMREHMALQQHTILLLRQLEKTERLV